MPPGRRCIYRQPDGRVTTAEAATIGEFLPVLAVELLVIGLVAGASRAFWVCVFLFWWLFGLGATAFFVALALVAPAAFVVGRRLPARPRRSSSSGMA